MNIANKQTDNEIIKNWCHTKMEVHKTNFVWIIDNIPFSFYKTGESFRSSKFFAGPSNELSYDLELYPNGDVCQFNPCMSLFINSHEESNKKVKYEISLLKENGDKIVPNSEFFDSGKKCGNSEIVSRTQVTLKDLNNLLPTNNLTILCCILVVVKKNIISKKTAISKFSTRKSNVLENLFQNKNFADITLAVENEEILAHKALLAARSEVFAAMFHTTMKEQITNRVEISDMNFGILKEMMEFIYTERAPNLKYINLELLLAADKYGLEDLKKVCVESLLNNLSVKTVVEVLIVADLQNIKILKLETLEYIKLNIGDVIQTSSWKQMVVSHPNLIEKVLNSFANKK